MKIYFNTTLTNIVKGLLYLIKDTNFVSVNLFIIKNFYKISLCNLLKTIYNNFNNHSFIIKILCLLHIFI